MSDLDPVAANATKKSARNTMLLRGLALLIAFVVSLYMGSLVERPAPDHGTYGLVVVLGFFLALGTIVFLLFMFVHALVDYKSISAFIQADEEERFARSNR